MSMGLAVTSVVAQNLGAGKLDRVSAMVRWCAGLGVAITGLVTLVAVLKADDPDRPVQPGARRAGRRQPLPADQRLELHLFVLVFVLGGVMRGAGDTMATLVLTIIGLWVVRVPAAYLLARSFGMGPAGIWTGILDLRDSPPSCCTWRTTPPAAGSGRCRPSSRQWPSGRRRMADLSAGGRARRAQGGPPVNGEGRFLLSSQSATRSPGAAPRTQTAPRRSSTRAAGPGWRRRGRRRCSRSARRRAASRRGRRAP